MDWRHHAVCRDEDPELFFPIGTSGPALLQVEQAKAVCRRCSVTDECLQWALESGQDAGVWGGMSEEERRAVKRRGGLRVCALTPPDHPTHTSCTPRWVRPPGRSAVPAPASTACRHGVQPADQYGGRSASRPSGVDPTQHQLDQLRCVGQRRGRPPPRPPPGPPSATAS